MGDEDGCGYFTLCVLKCLLVAYPVILYIFNIMNSIMYVEEKVNVKGVWR